MSPYTYQWSLQDWVWSDESMSPEWGFRSLYGTAAATVELQVQASAATQLTGRLQCLVVDATGRSAVASASVTANIS